MALLQNPSNNKKGVAMYDQQCANGIDEFPFVQECLPTLKEVRRVHEVGIEQVNLRQHAEGLQRHVPANVLQQQYVVDTRYFLVLRWIYRCKLLADKWPSMQRSNGGAFTCTGIGLYRLLKEIR